jgi:hypothetical protein
VLGTSVVGADVLGTCVVGVDVLGTCVVGTGVVVGGAALVGIIVVVGASVVGADVGWGWQIRPMCSNAHNVHAPPQSVCCAQTFPQMDGAGVDGAGTVDGGGAVVGANGGAVHAKTLPPMGEQTLQCPSPQSLWVTHAPPHGATHTSVAAEHTVQGAAHVVL